MGYLTVTSGSSGGSQQRHYVDGEAGQGSLIKTTFPPEILRHNISDDELEMFANTSRDGLSDSFWGCFGGALAALPAAIPAIHSAYFSDMHVAMTGIQQVEVLISTSLLCVSIAIKLIDKKKGSTTSALIKKIRARNKS